MKNKSLLTAVFIAVSGGVFSGCSLFSPAVPEINYYDLTFSEKTKFVVPCQLIFRNFQNISPVKINFLYSDKNSEQFLDQYNFWTQSPEIMLQRYLLNSIEYDKKAEKHLIVTLAVYDFKFNIADRKCQLGISARIIESHDGKKTEKNYAVEVPVESAERAAFVNGMNKCALEFSKQLVKDIQKF